MRCLSARLPGATSPPLSLQFPSAPGPARGLPSSGVSPCPQRHCLSPSTHQGAVCPEPGPPPAASAGGLHPASPCSLLLPAGACPAVPLAPGYSRSLFFPRDSGCCAQCSQALSPSVKDVRQPLTPPFTHATAMPGDYPRPPAPTSLPAR